MKLPVLLFLLVVSVYTSVSGSMSVQFITLGNCYLCAVRIQDAANTVNGVESVSWDYSTEITSVTYDETVTDVHTIMRAIADSGHDTEWYEAPYTAYKALLGTCCEYNRYLDYSNVQINYLSLMDIYVYPLSVNTVHAQDIDLYVHEHSLFVKSNDLKDISLIIYNTAGQTIFTRKLSGNQEIDISNLEGGHYIAVLTQKNKLISHKKFIKLQHEVNN